MKLEGLSMILMQAAGIDKAFVTTSILENVTLTVQERRRVGLVGVNGSGKSTLLKIIAGLTRADAGIIHTQKGLRIGYHAQLDELHSTRNVWDEMCAVFDHVVAMESRLRAMEQDMGRLHDEEEAAFLKLSDQYDALTRAYEDAGGYSWQSQIRGVLTGLGIVPAQYEQSISVLSGGERTRLKLAQLLLRGADLLLLDEPTNHLDLQAMSWLEGYLLSFAGSVIVVSHDRFFMDAVCTDIAEISLRHLTQYEGNYSLYIQKRAADIERKQKEFSQQTKYIDREKAIIRRLRGYATEKAIVTAKSREKRLNMVERVERPQGEAQAHFSFRAGRAAGRDVLIAQGLAKSFDDKLLFENLDLHIRAGERVAIIGPNGAGKTTLLHALLGKDALQSGTVQLGANVQIGYYDQKQQTLHPEKSVLNEVWDDFPRLEQTRIRGALGAFLIVGEEALQGVSTLSGGERGRVLMAKLMLREDNFLVLDEPTNHLDMDAREMLEDALFDYDGTMLVVSHDRFFINRLCDKIIELKDGKVREFLGNYDDYLEKLRTDAALLTLGAPAPTMTKTAQREEKKRSRAATEAAKRDRDMRKNMETRIETLEEEMTKLEIALSDADLYKDPSAARKLNERYSAHKAQLEVLYDEWANL